MKRSSALSSLTDARQPGGASRFVSFPSPRACGCHVRVPVCDAASGNMALSAGRQGQRGVCVMQHEAVCRITCGGRSRRRRGRRRRGGGGKGECSCEESWSPSSHSSQGDDCVLSPVRPRCVWSVRAEGPCRGLHFCRPQTQSHVLRLAARPFCARPRVALGGSGGGDGGGFGEDRFRGGHVGHWVHLLDLWNIKELGKMEIFNKFF